MDNKKDTTIKNKKEKLKDFLHKSKTPSGFLGATKPATSIYVDVYEGRRQVSMTKSPTRLTYAGRLKEIGGFKGQEPTIHGDWQHKGRVTDF